MLILEIWGQTGFSYSWSPSQMPILTSHLKRALCGLTHNSFPPSSTAVVSIKLVTFWEIREPQGDWFVMITWHISFCFAPLFHSWKKNSSKTFMVYFSLKQKLSSQDMREAGKLLSNCKNCSEKTLEVKKILFLFRLFHKLLLIQSFSARTCSLEWVLTKDSSTLYQLLKKKKKSYVPLYAKQTLLSLWSIRLPIPIPLTAWKHCIVFSVTVLC